MLLAQAGGASVAFSTDNGGQAWHVVHALQGRAVEMSFFALNREDWWLFNPGVLVGAQLGSTTDGGRTWAA